MRRIRTPKETRSTGSVTIRVVASRMPIVISTLIRFDGRAEERSAGSAETCADRCAPHVTSGGGANDSARRCTEAGALTSGSVT